MPTVDDFLAREIASRQQVRSFRPPGLMIEPGGDVAPVRPLSAGEIDSTIHDFADTAMHNLGLIPRVAMRGLTLATEPLARADTLTRATVATLGGKIPVGEYGQWFKDSLSGKRHITGDEFNRLMLSSDTYQMLQHTNLIPGWTKKIVNPDPYLGNIEEDMPVVSAASLFGLGAEMVISPFAIGFLPASVMSRMSEGVKAMKYFGAPARFSEHINNSLVAAASKISRDTPLGALMLQLRPVQRALVNHAELLDSLGADEKATRKASGFWKETLGKLWEDHPILANRGSANRVLDYLATGERQLAAATATEATSLAKVGQTAKAGLTLSDAELAAAHAIVEDVLVPLHSRLKYMGYHVVKPGELLKPIAADVTTKARTAGGEIAQAAVAKMKDIPKIPTEVGWFDPRVEMLKPFIIAGRHANKVATSLGKRTLEADLHVHLPWAELSSFKYTDLAEKQKDLHEALNNIIGAAEKKLIFEARDPISVVTQTGRTVAPITESRTVPSASASAFTPAKTATVVRDFTKVEKWHNSGTLSKFGPGDYWGKDKWNPLLKSMNAAEGHYWISKVMDITGHARGRLSIVMNQTGEAMWANLAKWAGEQSGGDALAAKSRYNRVFDYFYKKTSKVADPAIGYNWPQFTKVHHITSTILNNVMVATLAGNLRASLQNASGLVNAVSKHDFPTMVKGLYRMADFSEEGKAFRAVRGGINYGAEFQNIVKDEVWQQTGKRNFEAVVMWPFMTTENLVRGVASNIGIAREMERLGITSARDLVAPFAKGAEHVDLNKVILSGAREAVDMNFAYGVAGKSSLMMSAPARIGMALQSYFPNEVEFLAKTWSRDGGAFIRYMAFSGWLIDMADKIAGVNAESWIGWGFLPPNNLGSSPVLETWKNNIKMVMSMANDDKVGVDDAVNSIRGNVREIFRTFGDPNDQESFQVAFASAGMAGLAPVPVIGVGRTFKAINEFRTGRRWTGGDGVTWAPVTKGEAVKSWFFITHKEAEDKRIAAMEMSMKRQVYGELDRRVQKFVRVLDSKDRSGDAVREAGRELGATIRLTLPQSGMVKPLAPAYFRLGDETNFWPHPEMIQSRIAGRMSHLSVSKDVRAMSESGWLSDIIWAEYVNRGMRELDHGNVPGVK
jgi:hypothetical protein